MGAKDDDNLAGDDGNVRSSYVSSMVLMAASMGVSIDQALLAGGMTGSDLVDPARHLPIRVVPTVLKLLTRTYRAGHAPLALAQAMPVATHGPLHTLLVSAPDLDTVLDLFVASAPLLSKGLRLKKVQEAGEVLICFQHQADSLDGGLGAEFGLAIATRQHHELFDVPLARVQFRHSANTGLERYEAFFKAPVRFDAPFNALVFDEVHLPVLNRQPEVQAREVLEHRLELMLHRAGYGDGDRIADVRDAVALAAAQGDFSVAGVARLAGTSVRSLQRRLKREGVSATDLIEDAQCRLASALLANPRLSIEEVAERVGFNSERGFRRAYKRWTGRSPSRARREAFAGSGDKKPQNAG